MLAPHMHNVSTVQQTPVAPSSVIRGPQTYARALPHAASHTRRPLAHVLQPSHEVSTGVSGEERRQVSVGEWRSAQASRHPLVSPFPRSALDTRAMLRSDSVGYMVDHMLGQYWICAAPYARSISDA
eukprot:665444-Rhodomonas_salina.2